MGLVSLLLQLRGADISPLDLIGELTALIPRPRHHLVRYHGAFARGFHQPNAKILNRFVPAPKLQAKRQKVNQPSHKPASTEDWPSPDSPLATLSWAERLKRVFNIDILHCPECGGRLRVIADITDPLVINKALDHFARSPPIKLSAITPG
jgi:hypothetical protein